MADVCCQLVGNLDLGIDGCIISVSTSCNTELTVACETVLEGATIFNVNISAYADTVLWQGCPSRAGVSIPYIKKYDCTNNTTYFLFSGQGQSFYTGEATRYVTLHQELEAACPSMSASSSSGPAAIYALSSQINGYGMTYNGSPISFTTSAEGTEISLGGVLSGDYYLQSFSFEAQSGQFPVVSYSLVKAI